MRISWWAVIQKVLVSALWIAGGIAMASAGEVAAIPIVLAYLVYLWLFDGRWLIY